MRIARRSFSFFHANAPCVCPPSIKKSTSPAFISGWTTRPMSSSQDRTPGGRRYWALWLPGTQANPPMPAGTSRNCQVTVTASQ